MRTIKSVTASILVIAMPIFCQATENEPYFDANTNKLVVPRLEVNGQILHVEFNRVSSETLEFQVDLDSVVNLTEPEPHLDTSTGRLVIPKVELGDQEYFLTLDMVDPDTFTFKVDESRTASFVSFPTSPTESSMEMLGYWLILGGNKDYVLFNVDGTYQQVQRTVDPNDPSCPAGAENGYWSWSRNSGIFVVKKIWNDQNGECGFSASAVRRFVFEDLNTLRLRVTEDGITEDYTLIRSSFAGVQN